jgi:hypothetical protein
MVDVQTCPSLEDIAAFLDGRVTADERARLIRHLADCPTCLAVFAGAAQFLAEEAAVGGGREGGAASAAGAGVGDEPAALEADRKNGEEISDTTGEATTRAAEIPGREAGAEDPGAAVVPAREATLDAPPYSAPLLPFRRLGRARPGQVGAAPGSARWPRGLVAGLAAALLVIAVGVPMVFFRMSSKAPTSADLVKPLIGRKDLLSHRYREKVLRGPSPQAPPFLSSSQEFMLGVNLLDFYLALAADNNPASEEKARNILNRMGETPPPARQLYQDAVGLATSHGSPRSLLSRALAAERALEELEEPDSNLPVGRWVETARLAAASGNRDFFHSGATLSFLSGVLDRKEDILDPSTRPVLENIHRRVESDHLGDLGSLYRDLDQLIRTNEAKSKSPD